MSVLIIHNKTGGYIYQVVSGELLFAATDSEKEQARKIFFYSKK